MTIVGADFIYIISTDLKPAQNFVFDIYSALFKKYCLVILHFWINMKPNTP